MLKPSKTRDGDQRYEAEKLAQLEARAKAAHAEVIESEKEDRETEHMTYDQYSAYLEKKIRDIDAKANAPDLMRRMGFSEQSIEAERQQAARTKEALERTPQPTLYKSLDN